MPSVDLLITGFLAIVFVALFISVKARLPYTVVLVVVGIVLAVVPSTIALGGGPVQSLIAQISTFTLQLVSGQNGNLFVGLVVPPLLFEAMMHISSRDLKAIFRPAITLATVGVVVATLVGGIILWQVVGLPLFVAFLFAAVISPTDTATVLEIFRRIKVPTRLAALLDTEAAFNDATGIVIFSVVLTAISLPSFQLSSTVISFLLTFGGGLAVGFGVAFVAELLTSAISHRIATVVLTITAVYGSYALAENFGFSGLIAVTVVGLYFGNLTMKSAMGTMSREFVRLFWEIAAFFANSIAFLFIGFREGIFVISSYTLILVVLAYLAIVASRAASVYPILTMFDRFGKEKIPMKWRHVAMIGGVRGALSIALAASITTSTVISQSYLGIINTLVFGVALITIIGQSGILSRYAIRAFAENQTSVHEELNVRLAKARSAIETLEKLRQEGKIAEAEFAEQLEKDKDDLTEVLSEINYKMKATNIALRRATGLYSSVVSLRESSVMNVLRRHSMSNSVETMVEKTEKGPDGSENGKN